MVSEEKARRLIVQNVYKTLDTLGYEKKDGSFRNSNVSCWK